MGVACPTCNSSGIRYVSTKSINKKSAKPSGFALFLCFRGAVAYASLLAALSEAATTAGVARSAEPAVLVGPFCSAGFTAAGLA